MIIFLAIYHRVFPAAISIAERAGGVKRLNPGCLLDSTKKAGWTAAAAGG